jgi:hypothetical protein
MEKWISEFEAAKKPNLTWLPSVSVDARLDKFFARPPWRVDFSPPPGRHVPNKFDLLILCRGLGQERGIAKKNAGMLKPLQFWEKDPYPLSGGPTLPDWRDLPETLDCAVVILGGGDGAIQDMLRFVTNGLDARAILDQVLPLAPPNLVDELASITGQVENEIRHNAFAKRSPQLAEDVHRQISALVTRIATRQFSQALDNQGLFQCHSIRVYFKDPSLGPCYPLNRFLALLFQRCLMQIAERELLFPNQQVHSVDCSCTGDDHFNQPHTVFFAEPNSASSVTCRVVVPRIGIDPASVQCQRRFQSVYHALPYWLGEWKPI